MRAPDVLPQPYGYYRVTTCRPPSRSIRWVPLIALFLFAFDACFQITWNLLP